MAFDVEAAKADGYTDEQIKEFLNPQSVERLDQKKDESGASVSPYVDRGPEAVGTAQLAGANAAYDIAKYGTLGGGAYIGAKKIAQALRGPAPGPVVPASVPTATPAPAPTTFTGGANAAFDKALSQPYMRPTVPGQPVVGAPQTIGIGQDIASRQPSVIQRGMDIASKMREIAASKVIVGAGLMATPGNAGQNYPFPQAGPMRGQEINPATGRPWTPQELQAYNLQPGMQ